MSISNRHSVVLFAPGTKPQAEQRLAKVGYKSSKTKPAKFPSVCVSVPHIQAENITENISGLLPHIATMLEDAQDGIIRRLYEQAKGKLPMSVADEDISVAACVKFLDAQAEGDRLTKDSLTVWFQDCLAENLTVYICEALKTENLEDARVVQNLKGYRDLFTGLSGSQVLTPNQIRKLDAACKMATDDRITERVQALLSEMMTNLESQMDLI